MLDVMEAAKVPANTATYTAIIDCLIWRRGEQSVRAALQLLDKMEGDGVHTKEATFTSLLAGVSRADYLHPEVQSRLVDEIMSMMCARGMDPNCVTRNFLLLDARKTDGILGTDKAMKLWRETIAEKGGGISHTTYFVLLSGLAKNGKYNYCTISLIPAVPCPDPPAGPVGKKNVPGPEGSSRSGHVSPPVTKKKISGRRFIA